MGAPKRNVYFFCPSFVLGGAELLFLRCADYLANYSDKYVVSYIDYDGGSYFKLDNIVHVTFVKYRNSPVEVVNDSIVILPLSYISSIDYYFVNPQSLKFLYWSLNPTNLTRQINLYNHKLFLINKKTRTKIGEYLKMLTDRGVIRYMDYNNYYFSSSVFLFDANSVDYLPISVEDFDIDKINGLKKKPLDSKNLTFLWLGRLDKDKFNTIVVFINELENMSNDYNIVFLIVGSGSKEEELKKICKKRTICVEFLGKVYGEELNSIIDKRVDIGLAMGTSALDIAKRCKPVILEGFLDKIYSAGSINDFICLNSSEFFDVVSPGYYARGNGNTFSNVVKSILADYERCANLCAQHVYSNFLMGVNGLKLISAIENINSNYHISDYENIVRINTLLNKSFLWKVKKLLIKIKSKI